MNPVLVGNHASIKKIRELISVIADTAFPVLILGETGCGKDVVARLLHCSSKRKTNRFIKINCAALPITLLESELFGYEKGAFTGAVGSKAGKFEMASNGVIFLDEIGEMHQSLQAKFLQVIQSGEFSRLGGTTEIRANAWVMASTNRDLTKEMTEGRFREDLYYRLNIIKFELPPLRNRKEDISLLWNHFVDKYTSENPKSEPRKTDKAFIDLLQSYYWPGNVREMSSMALRMVLGENPEKIKAEILHFMQTGHMLPDSENTAQGGGYGAQNAAKPLPKVKSLKEIKSDASKFIEKKLILNALRATGWNKRRASEMLQLSYKALFYKMDEYDIVKPRSSIIIQRQGVAGNPIR